MEAVTCAGPLSGKSLRFIIDFFSGPILVVPCKRRATSVTVVSSRLYPKRGKDHFPECTLTANVNTNGEERTMVSTTPNFCIIQVESLTVGFLIT